MKSLVTIIVAALVAFVVSYGTVHMAVPQNVTVMKTEAKKESAYDRVMRTGVLKCGIFIWPPYIEKDANTGELKGFSKNILERMVNLLDLKVQFVELQLGMQKQDLESGKVDAICGDGPWYATSIKYVSYTTPYEMIPVFAFKRAGNTTITSNAGLNNPAVSFVGVDGDLSVDLAKAFFPKAKMQTLSNMTDPSQLLLNVVTKKADVTIIDSVAGKAFTDANPGQVEKVSEKPVAIYKASFSVAKDETKFYETLNNMIETAINLGIVDQELDAYDPKQELIYRPRSYYGEK